MPIYQHAPIEEALCEFTFAPTAPTEQWDMTLPGRIMYHPNLKDIYVGPSRQQTVQQVVSDMMGGPNAPTNIAVSSTLLRVLIPTADQKAVLGIGPYTLSISSMRPYEGWDNAFKARIHQALNAYRDVAKPTMVNRIILKYINRLVAPMPGTIQAAKYLRDINPTIEAKYENADPFTATLSSYHVRKEFTTTDHTKIYVTQATLQPADPVNTSEFLLDIEVVWDHSSISDFTRALAIVDQLHAIEGAIFEAVITDEARNLFNAA